MSETMLYTPRSSRTKERQRFRVGFSAALTEDDDVDILDELIRQTWSIFGVSALFGFEQTELHFKQYAKRLREEVANSLTKEDVAYDVNISFLKNDSPNSDTGHPPPIKILVNAKTTDREKNVEKCIYKGILISWKTEREELNAGNCVRLPLLLCHGTQSCIQAVHSTLSKMFDCMVIALPAKEDDLMWLVPIVIMPSRREDTPKSTEEARLEYVLPGLPFTGTFASKFKVVDLVKSLTIINEDLNDYREVSFNEEHIEKFYEVLYTQSLEIGSIQLGQCMLRRIDLPALTIMENKMKVKNVEAMNRVLLYLNDKALDTFHTLHFGS